MRKFLSRLLKERTGDTITQSGSAELRGVDAAASLGNPDEGVHHAAFGEPSPVEADEAAWQREREKRERDGR